MNPATCGSGTGSCSSLQPRAPARPGLCARGAARGRACCALARGPRAQVEPQVHAGLPMQGSRGPRVRALHRPGRLRGQSKLKRRDLEGLRGGQPRPVLHLTYEGGSHSRATTGNGCWSVGSSGHLGQGPRFCLAAVGGDVVGAAISCTLIPPSHRSFFYRLLTPSASPGYSLRLAPGAP